MYRRYLSISILMICLIGINQAPYTAQSQANVLSPVEFVGNPFKAKYPAGEAVFARNVWDMAVYNGRLYFGHGNSDNAPPAANAGPIDVWYYDASTNRFTNEYTVDEEQIERFRIINGTLYIPGHDPKGSPDYGNFYRWNNGAWEKVSTIPGAIHVYDLYYFQDKLFAALGIGMDGYTVTVSDDLGETWKQLYVPAQLPGTDMLHASRAFEFFEVGDQLLVSTRPALHKVPDPQYGYRYAPLESFYEYTENGFQPVETDFFPGHPPTNYYQRLARSVKFLDRTVYVGADIITDHHWSPFGLFSVGAAFDVVEYSIACRNGAVGYSR